MPGKNAMAILTEDEQLYDRLGISPNQLYEYCQRWKVAELSIFGSALTNDFHKDSDIDVLITFSPDARKGLLTISKMQRELEELLSRKVDLTSKKSIEQSRNAVRRANILESAQVLYVA
jgi:uncharacterized protein